MKIIFSRLTKITWSLHKKNQSNAFYKIKNTLTRICLPKIKVRYLRSGFLKIEEIFFQNEQI